VRYSLIRSRIAGSSSTTRIWASKGSLVIVVWGILARETVESYEMSTEPVFTRDARPSARAAPGPSPAVRQTLAYVAFGAVYYLLAAYAASLPFHAPLPMFIWPAPGVALGALLVSPGRRWPGYLVLVFLATLAVGL